MAINTMFKNDYHGMTAYFSNDRLKFDDPYVHYSLTHFGLTAGLTLLTFV